MKKRTTKSNEIKYSVESSSIFQPRCFGRPKIYNARHFQSQFYDAMPGNKTVVKGPAFVNLWRSPVSRFCARNWEKAKNRKIFNSRTKWPRAVKIQEAINVKLFFVTTKQIVKIICPPIRLVFPDFTGESTTIRYFSLDREIKASKTGFVAAVEYFNVKERIQSINSPKSEKCMKFAFPLFCNLYSDYPDRDHFIQRTYAQSQINMS